MLRPPVPWHVEIARPDVESTFSSSVLVGNIIPRISPERDRPAIGDHPTVQVFASLKAHGDDATVAIDVARLTANGRASNPVGQGQASLLSTTPVFAGRPNARLPTLWGIDAKETNPLAVNLNGAMTEATPTISAPRADAATNTDATNIAIRMNVLMMLGRPTPEAQHVDDGKRALKHHQTWLALD